MKPSYPSHFKIFDENIKEVRHLLDIHGKIAGKTPGRKYNVEVLNKSGIVLLVACWESYVEQLATAAFEYLIGNASFPDDIPVDVRLLASKNLRESKDERMVWQLAGDGWKEILVKHKDQVLKDSVYRMNTPKTDNIDKLFKSIIGYENASRNWKMPKFDSKKICDKLDKLIELRGNIAHQVKASKYVSKYTVINHINFIEKLSILLNNDVDDHLKLLTGKRPWGQYKYSYGG